MTQPLFSRLCIASAICANLCLALNSCQDDSYDLNKVDLTMGLGSDGLAVKFGSTEDILLKDILDIKEDDDVKIDNNREGLFYLVEKGNTDIDISVDKVSTKINDSHLDMDFPVLNYNSVLEQVVAAGVPVNDGDPVPVAADLKLVGEASGNSSVDFTIEDINDIAYINNLDVQDIDVSLNLYKKNTPAELPLGITKLENVTITIPAFLEVKEMSAGWTLNGNKLVHTGEINYVSTNPELCHLKVSKINLDRAPKYPSASEKKNGVIELTEAEAKITISGKVTFKNTKGSQFYMSQNQEASVELDLNMSPNNVNIKQFTGKFDPEIDPAIDPIDVRGSLPDYLNDESVRIDVTNPTVRFDADLSSVPVGVNVGATLISKFDRNASLNKTVTIAPTSTMEANQYNTLYFYQSGEPYDPAGLPATYAKKQVDNLSTLLEKVPDEIEVNLKNGQVSVQDKTYTIELGRTYKTNATYNVYVPFIICKELVVVYNDSTDSMNSDLKDLSAKGLRINAVAKNAIPLDLEGTVEAYGVDGKVIKEITFDKILIKAGPDEKENGAWKTTETNVEINATLTDEKALSKVDKFKFNIHAASSIENKRLVSDQYIKLTDVRLRLKGGVTADFN